MNYEIVLRSRGAATSRGFMYQKSTGTGQFNGSSIIVRNSAVFLRTDRFVE
jgi:hypothetical protein